MSLGDDYPIHPAQHQQRYDDQRIEQIHKMNDCTYGRPRMQAELRDMGIRINHKRVERLMHLAHIKGVSRRRAYTVTYHRT